MADQIKVDIVAAYKDKAAKDALKDAEKIEQADPELTITADVEDKATDDLKGVTELAEKLDKADATIVLQAKVDVAQANLKEAKTALMDLDGMTVEAKVDVDTTGAQQGVKNLGAESDNTKSVLANMVGNTGQDLGELGGIAGTAGMAIGQLGEYATEGNISLQGLSKMAGPMLGVAAAGMAINDIMSKMAQGQAARKAFNKDQIEQFEKALRDGADAAKEYRESLADTGEVMANTGIKAGPMWAKLVPGVGPIVEYLGLIGKFGNVLEDILPLLNQAGISSERWTSIIASDEPVKAMDTLRAALDQTTISEEERHTILVAAGNAQDNYTDAVKNTTQVEKFFGDALDDVEDSAKGASKNVRDFNADTIDAKNAADNAATAVAQFDAKIRLLLGEIDEEAAYLTMKGNLDDLRTHLYEVGSATDEGRLDILAIRKEYLLWLGDLEGVPEYKQTEIVALINQDEFDKVDLELAKLQKSRFVEYTPVLKKGGLSGLPPGVGAGASSFTPPPGLRSVVMK